MIPLSGGFPNPAMFPFVKTVIETIDGKFFSYLAGIKLVLDTMYED